MFLGFVRVHIRLYVARLDGPCVKVLRAQVLGFRV